MAKKIKLPPTDAIKKMPYSEMRTFIKKIDDTTAELYQEINHIVILKHEFIKIWESAQFYPHTNDGEDR